MHKESVAGDRILCADLLHQWLSLLLQTHAFDCELVTAACDEHDAFPRQVVHAGNLGADLCQYVAHLTQLDHASTLEFFFLLSGSQCLAGLLLDFCAFADRCSPLQGVLRCLWLHHRQAKHPERPKAVHCDHYRTEQKAGSLRRPQPTGHFYFFSARRAGVVFIPTIEVALPEPVNVGLNLLVAGLGLG